MDLQIEIDDTDDEMKGGGGTNHHDAPPSAPKQGNFIQFEEVQGASQNFEGEEDVRREDIYDMYGRGSVAG